MEKLISFDLKADFGFFKKPDVNDGLQLSYNMLHKPALLGILGAVLGMEGYREKGKLPEYFARLAEVRIGIEPLEGFHERGNFSKTVVTYTNTVGYANADGNLIVHEHTLVRPAYRCYLGLAPSGNEDHHKLYEAVLSGEAVYVPYLGKNEFHAWWEPECALEWEWKPYTPEENFRIDSLFIRSDTLKTQRIKPGYSYSARSLVNNSSFAYFERLPVGFRNEPDFIQYELAEFAYTDWVLAPASRVEALFLLNREDFTRVIQLF